MLKRRGDFALSPEPAEHHGTQQIGRKNLDYDLSPKRQVHGQEEPAHSATLHLRLNVVHIGEALLQLLEHLVRRGLTRS